MQPLTRIGELFTRVVSFEVADVLMELIVHHKVHVIVGDTKYLIYQLRKFFTTVLYRNMDAVQGSGLDMSKLSDVEKRDLQQFVMNESQKIKIQQSTFMILYACTRAERAWIWICGHFVRSREASFTSLRRWS